MRPTGRPPGRTFTTSLRIAVTLDMRDRFFDACHAHGEEGSSVIRRFIDGYIEWSEVGAATTNIKFSALKPTRRAKGMASRS